MSAIVPLSDALDESLAGGKGANLARMLRLGLPVPAGVVVSRGALDAFLAADGLGEHIEARLAGLAGLTGVSVASSAQSDEVRRPRSGCGQNHDALRDAAAEIRQLVLGAPMRHDERTLVRALWQAMDERGPLAVRSSAIGEDSATDSFAGQLDSVLGVASTDALSWTLRTCWASLWSERAIFYRAVRGLPMRGMGVVVQRQVDARAAGVLFSRGGGDRMLVEYCAGLAEDLVAGRVDPGRFSIRRSDGFVVHEARAPGLDREAEELLTQRRTTDALAAYALELERAFGGRAQDVEWAMDHEGSVFLVQSRPITVPLPREDSPLTLWSNANVSENFPEPVSPFLYSFASAGYAHYFRNLALAFGLARRRVRAMEPYFERIIGVHGARIYYNLTSIHAVLRMAPFGAELTRSFNRFVGASRAAAQPPEAAAWDKRARWRQALELVPVAVSTSRRFLRLGRGVARFERTIDDYAARTHPDRLPALPLHALGDLLRELVEIRCHRWLDASLADAASMLCYGALERLLAASLPRHEQSSLQNTLLKALPNVVSNGPTLRLWELSRLVRDDAALSALVTSTDTRHVLDAIEQEPRFAVFRDAFREYLEEWGFRCSAELMLTSPSFQEDPAPLIQLVRAYAAMEGPAPRATIAAAEEDRVRETRRVLAEIRGTARGASRVLPWRGWAVAALLRRTQAAIAYRERARLKQALLYSRCRRLVLEIGRRLVDAGRLAGADDAFFLTHEELSELLAGHSMFADDVPRLVELRREAHERLGRTSPPDTFELAEGEYLALDGTANGAVGDDAEHADDAAHTEATGGATSMLLSGVAACGGVADAPAMVLRDVMESSRLERGDVLVTRQTDPGWGPAFFLVSGLVIERGGMLSHGAILAREFGLPCVVGVRDATRRIQSGARVIVDGDRGHVRIPG